MVCHFGNAISLFAAVATVSTKAPTTQTTTSTTTSQTTTPPAAATTATESLDVSTQFTSADGVSNFGTVEGAITQQSAAAASQTGSNGQPLVAAIVGGIGAIAVLALAVGGVVLMLKRRKMSTASRRAGEPSGQPVDSVASFASSASVMSSISRSDWWD